jgi:alkylation response protein AidB-like acyl-CoA dehydrogenase
MAEEGNAMRREWATILHSGGYSGLRWPKEYGGCGLGPVEAAIFYEECARAHAPEAVDNSPRSVGVTLAGPAIIAYGTEDQKRRYLPKILDAGEVWCEGFSEPGAGSDLAAVSTVATFDGEVFRVNGSKIWTTHAHEADRCYLLAKTSPDAPRHHNLSVFLFDMRQPGVTVTPLKNIAGELEFNQVFFDNAVVRKEDLLGELDGGWKLVTIGAAALRSSGGDGGTSVYWSRYVQMSSLLERLKENTRVDPKILGGLQARLDTLWWANARAAGAVGEEEGFAAIRGGSNILKIALSELLQEIAAVGMELARPEDLAFWRREYLMSRSRSIAGGTSQIQRNVIADQVLRLRKA